MKKVFTVGVFDLLHIGHILLFKNAKKYGDYLIVAVQESESISKYKPNIDIVYNTEERCFMVEAIKYVNEVVTYKDVADVIQYIDFDVFITGPDQQHDGFQKAFEWCKNHGKEVVTIPSTEGISSSILRAYFDCPVKER